MSFSPAFAPQITGGRSGCPHLLVPICSSPSARPHLLPSAHLLPICSHLLRDGAGYDAAGDLLSPPPPDPNAGARSFEYDGEHRLLETTDAGALIEYVYDAGGRRVRSTLPGAAGETTWHQLYDLAGRPLAAVDDQGHWLRSEVWANGQLLATLTPDGVSYAHLDGQGSLRARSRADGSLGETCTALPFGDNLLCTGSAPSPLHFTGKPRDEETGLDDFGARLYSSSLGRWMTPDWAAQAEPVPYAKLDNPQSLNLYTYVLNNPVTNIDPDGHIDCSGKNANGIGCRTIASWKAKFQGAKAAAENAKKWSAAHPKTVKTAMAAVMVATALSGAFDGGASEAALPEEAAAGEALAESGASAGADASEVEVTGQSGEASTPVGRGGSPMKVAPGTNEPATIGGREYSGHALDQMQGRGITPSVVEDAVQNGTRSAARGGCIACSTPDVKVIINSAGKVVTVYPQ